MLLRAARRLAQNSSTERASGTRAARPTTAIGSIPKVSAPPLATWRRSAATRAAASARRRSHPAHGPATARRARLPSHRPRARPTGARCVGVSGGDALTAAVVVMRSATFAKSLLGGSSAEPAPERGSWTPINEGGQTIGGARRTRTRVKPVFVSPGHRISLTNACRHVLALAPYSQSPEPIRRADHLSRRARSGRAT
jgi:Endonuclease V